ncbi:hypothetical protein ACH5RR_032544 [Cinchona calisaya]|uniref:Uncharacterized protein n=1 Tax=Cinchona calisaya TaxID=153742 RepID=A0ABD2YID5_9GENT
MDYRHKFLKKINCLDEILLLENESGNFKEVEIAKDIMRIKTPTTTRDHRQNTMIEATSVAPSRKMSSTSGNDKSIQMNLGVSEKRQEGKLSSCSPDLPQTKTRNMQRVEALLEGLQ